ncbi:MAG: FHA domain-containing protein, partial [Bradymonadaceae bacterium]
LEITENPDESYTLQDLQSVNGTYLNGKQIEEARLFHGDRIKVGQSELQFVVPGGDPQQQKQGDRHMVPAATETADGQAAAPQAAAPPRAAAEPDELTKWLNRIIVVASVLALLVVATAGGVFLYQSRTGTSNKKKNAAQKAYMTAIEAIKNRQWKRARQKFNRAVQKNPELDVSARLAQIEQELEAKKKLQQARSELEEGRRQRAIDVAKTVPRQSFYYDQARELIRRQKRKQRLENLYEKAAEAKEKEEYEQALSTIEKILDVVPNHEKALVLRHRIQQAEKTSDEEKKTAGADSGQTAVAARNEGGSGGSGSGGG